MDSFESNRAVLSKDFKYGSEAYNELAETKTCELRGRGRGAYYSRMARAFSEALGKVAKAKTKEDLDNIRHWIDAEICRAGDEYIKRCRVGTIASFKSLARDGAIRAKSECEEIAVYYRRVVQIFNEIVAKAEAATSLAQLDEIRIWGEAETKRVWCAFELAMQEKPAEWAILDRDLIRH